MTSTITLALSSARDRFHLVNIWATILRSRELAPKRELRLGEHLHVVIEFRDEATAIRFERYLKSASGRAFATRHFGA